MDCDVLVVGSGAAGLAAAIGAASEGAEVIVLERSGKIGGTSAVSGGTAWVPCNGYMASVGVTDSVEDARTYLSGQPTLKDEAMLATYVEVAAHTISFLEENSSLRFHAAMITDYFPDLPGSKPAGRCLAPDPFDASVLGDDALRVRKRVYADLERSEAKTASADSDALLPEDRIVDGSATLDWGWAEAEKRGTWARGLALVGGLLEGCRRHDVRVITDTRVTRLVVEDDRVTGVIGHVAGDESISRFRARAGVVLASGGFEWSDELMARFIEAPRAVKGSPRWNEGDGLRMAMSIGASVGNLGSAWWNVFAQVPDDEPEDGQAIVRVVTAMGRSKPGLIMVNSMGNRFVNEAHPYHGIALTMNAWDPVTGGYPNLPAWLIFDRTFRTTYGLPGVLDRDTVDPPWLTKSDTLRELSNQIGIDPDALGATVDRFNEFVREGNDADFGRGNDFYDQQYGDTSRTGSARCLGELRSPPWYALEVHPGIIGTNGGVIIDEHGRVLDSWGDPIEGLFGAGNVTASFMGRTNIGPGATLGPAMVFGCIAGRTAAQMAVVEQLAR